MSELTPINEDTPMNGTKPAIASTGIWGVVIIALCTYFPAVAAKLGLTDPATQQQLIQVLTAIGTAVGLGMALWGRIGASKAIAGLFRSPTTPPSSGSGAPPATANLLLVLFALPVAAALLLGLSACSTTDSTSTAPAASASSAVSLDSTKALYAAEAAYNGMASGLSAAVDSGALKGANAKTASQLLSQAYTALQTARAAYTLGQSSTVLTQASSLLALAAQVEPLLHPQS